MEKTIAVIGGDMRTVILAKMLAKENKVITYGQELQKEATINQVASFQKVIEEAEIIIAPIPFSKDGENIYAEFSKNKIPIKELMQYSKGKTLIGGAISQDFYNLAQEYSIKVIDLMNNESLTILNTIATAEGAVQVAMQRTKRIIHGSKVLILGFGRVGKVTAQKFNGLSAHITCAARKQEAFAWIEACGYKQININKLGDNLKEYDIIINTPPTLILTREKLKKLKSDCLVIDLASRPGGVDIDAAKELGINFEWAQGLPGKVAPFTAAEHIKQTLDYDVLKGENNDNFSSSNFRYSSRIY